MTPFDPYHKWLGILPTEHPVNHYRLLAIAPFEANADVIDNATELRLAYLRTMRTGAYALYSEQLIGEVERARDVLLDPVKRVQYEQLLRERLAGMAAQPPMRPAMMPVALPAAAMAPPIRPTLPAAPQPILDHPVAIAPDPAPLARRRARGGSSGRFVYNTVLGGVLGVVIGYLILCNLRPEADFLGLFPDAPSAPPDSNRAPPKRVVNRSEAKSDPIDEPVKPKPPQPRPRPRIAPDKPAVKAEAPDPFAGLPDAIELPPPSNTTEVTLFELPASLTGPVSLRLDTVAKLPASLAFVIRQVAQTQHYEIAAGRDNGPVIARLLREGPAIRFRWVFRTIAPPVIAQLRNSVLRLDAAGGSKSIGLRRAVEQPPLRVSLKAPRGVHPVSIDAPPSQSSLRVEIGDLSQFPVGARLKDDVQGAGVGKPLTVALDKLNDADHPELEIVFLAGDDRLRLEIQSRLVTPGKTYDLTTRVVEEQKKWLASRRPVVGRELDAVTTEGKAIEARIAKIKSRVPRDQADRRLQAQELPKLRDRLDVLNARYKVLMEQKAQLDRAERGIPPVEELVRKLHETASIPFRIFAQVGDTELDLVRSEGYSDVTQ